MHARTGPTGIGNARMIFPTEHVTCQLKQFFKKWRCVEKNKHSILLHHKETADHLTMFKVEDNIPPVLTLMTKML